MVIGVLFQYYIYSSVYYFPIFLSLVIAFVFLRKGAYGGIIAILCLFFLGASLGYRDTPKKIEFTLSSYNGAVLDSPQKLSGWHRFPIHIDGGKSEKTWKSQSFNIICYLEESIPPPQTGDQVVLLKTPSTIDTPRNPGEFNFRHYWALKNIQGQLFIKNRENLQVMHEEISTIEKFRNYIKHTISSNINDEMVAGLLGTLFTGDKSLIDYRTKKSFAATGSVHLLAVSGLHIGVIFLFASFILAPLKHYKLGRPFYLIAVLFVIWFYALLTGLAPSVFRAAIMFSVFTIANTFWLRSITINNTFLAAFIILLLDTKALFDPGFLFSFIAVLGIVILYRPLYAKLTFRNKIADYCWLMTSISLAAQIATFPLVVYYFHQFPVYFLISNLLLIPLTALLLYGGVAWMLLVSVPGLGMVLTWCITLIGKAIISIVFFIQSIPGSLLTGLRLSPWEMIVVYGIILFCCYSFLCRKAFVLKYALAFTIILFCSKVITFYIESHQKKLAIFHLPYHTAITFINGKTSTTFHDDWKNKRQKILDFHIEPALQHFGIVSNNFIPLDNIKTINGLQVLKSQGQKTGVLDMRVYDNTKTDSSNLSLEVLVLRNNFQKAEVELPLFLKNIVVDGSSGIGNHIDYHYTHDGAYIKDLTWSH